MNSVSPQTLILRNCETVLLFTCLTILRSSQYYHCIYKQVAWAKLIFQGLDDWSQSSFILTVTVLVVPGSR